MRTIQKFWWNCLVWFVLHAGQSSIKQRGWWLLLLVILKLITHFPILYNMHLLLFVKIDWMIRDEYILINLFRFGNAHNKISLVTLRTEMKHCVLSKTSVALNWFLSYKKYDFFLINENTIYYTCTIVQSPWQTIIIIIYSI